VISSPGVYGAAQDLSIHFKKRDIWTFGCILCEMLVFDETGTITRSVP